MKTLRSSDMLPLLCLLPIKTTRTEKIHSANASDKAAVKMSIANAEIFELLDNRCNHH